jgi:alkanesulfonate monooxygenase SsuD/methylene tetrahydromethanopterin reductase-like flavin-dependent oxidoreductase (luciferase family)
MKFGVFDHVDDSGLPLAGHLEARLRLAEAYDALGFHCYHVAEHHGTPLGLAPSPGVFFAAVSQRTTRLNFGPLVYLLPIYHPLRLVEEVAMLDALSNGRFQLGIGRGVSPIELGFYGLDMAEQRARFDETLAVLLAGLSSDVLEFEGQYYAYDRVPMALRPVQRPHPPLWYGAGSPDSIRWCAQNGVNMVTLALGDRVRQVTDLYRSEWQGGADAIPLMGISRHIVVADSDEGSEGAGAARLCPLARVDGQAVGGPRHGLSARRPPAGRMGRCRGDGPRLRRVARDGTRVRRARGRAGRGQLLRLGADVRRPAARRGAALGRAVRAARDPGVRGKVLACC